MPHVLVDAEVLHASERGLVVVLVNILAREAGTSQFRCQPNEGQSPS